MWLFTKIGFYSIVKNSEVKNSYLVRARVKKDLANLCELMGWKGIKIYQHEDKDYRFRIFINKQLLHLLMEKMGDQIDYPNFKDAVMRTPNQQDKKKVLTQVWNTMWSYQYNSVKSKRKNKDLYDDLVQPYAPHY